MPKYKFTFHKPADMIIETDTMEQAVKVMELRLKTMRFSLKNVDKIDEAADAEWRRTHNKNADGF